MVYSIRKNASTSPLLLLASEVREKILINLLGDNLIHVKYLDTKRLWYANNARNEILRLGATEDVKSEPSLSPGLLDPSNDNDEDDDSMDSPFSYLNAPLGTEQQPYQTAFRHAICVAKGSEQSAYKEAVSGYVAVPKWELSPDHYVTSCEERHLDCKMCGSGPMFLLEEELQDLRVDLNVLGVCRQLYEEANHLLWATNTFSFEDPKTFGHFFRSLNPAQKRNLTRLHITADIGELASYYYSSAYQRARWDNNYWGTVLKTANLNMLRGVQALHLCINQGFDCLSRGQGHGIELAEEKIKFCQEADMEIILRLRALPLKHVTVMMSDDAERLDNAGWSSLRWTAAKKNEYAESIRLKLIDPDGAKLVKTKDEAANLARNTDIKNNAATRVETYKSILRDKRAEMVRSAKRARHEEAKAESAAKQADQVCNKSSKKSAKLHNAAEKQKERALCMRARADLAAEKVEYWQEQVATAREKYKRAMARWGATPEEIEDELELERIMPSLSDSEKKLKMESSEDDDSSEDDKSSEDDMTPAHRSVRSEDDESLSSGPEDESSNEDDEDDEEFS